MLQGSRWRIWPREKQTPKLRAYFTDVPCSSETVKLRPRSRHLWPCPLLTAPALDLVEQSEELAADEQRPGSCRGVWAAAPQPVLSDWHLGRLPLQGPSDWSQEPLCQSQTPEPAPLDLIREDLLFQVASPRGPQGHVNRKMLIFPVSLHLLTQPIGRLEKVHVLIMSQQPLSLYSQTPAPANQPLKARPLLLALQCPSGHCPRLLELSRCPAVEGSVPRDCPPYRTNFVRGTPR